MDNQIQILADKFSKKKTFKNDVLRMQNIQNIQNTQSKIRFNLLQPFNVKYSVQNNERVTNKNNALTTSDENENIIVRFKNKNIKKIYHVYQEKYGDNSFPTGFGDFVRSCFFIIQFCNKHQIQYEIIINHPIALFFKNFYDKYSPNSFFSSFLNNKVFKFRETNWHESVFDKKNYIEHFVLSKKKIYEFMEYLCNLTLFNNCVYSYNIFFPYNEISIQEQNIISSLFEPSVEIEEKVNQNLFNLKLVEKDYIVIHIRSGDSYLKDDNKTISPLFLKFIKNEIIELKQKNLNKNMLLISDNNKIKLLLNNIFNEMKFIIYNITHIGEGFKLEYAKVQNTIIDFFLMSKASHIYSFTSYPHGSGFSYWCSKIFNIPYKCKFIK